MDRTAEQLRSKHVRTLELLQKTLDENAEMKKRLESKGGFQLAMGQGVDLSKRVYELENEIDRLKKQCTSLTQTNDSDRVKCLEQRVRELETANFNLQYNLTGKQLLVTELQQERTELRESMTAAVAKADARGAQDAEVLAKALAARANAEAECLRMTDTIEKLQKKEWTFAEQIEALRAQKAAFENEHAALYRTLEEKERQMDEDRERLRRTQDELDKLRGNQRAPRLPELRGDVAQAPQITPEALDEALRPVLTRNKQLMRDNQTLREQVESLSSELSQVQHRLASATTFAAHIDLKKENFLLRQQIEEMQGLQKKFLGTAKKQTFQFTNQRG
ncbi:hypothetical protein ACHHYP_12875 [Achlya hypogyna]|uniref:Uncharacterized protein n=1 Tax=Achlya hypogyna TaxID=1202772 RepID=A0A1V9ZG77_ACHHY|nr:hypothetical protein ACHHYP_12875 [Achlya hypogyna]